VINKYWNNFVLEKPLKNIKIILFLFVLSRLFDYISTDFSLALGFTEHSGNWLYYGLNNWHLFWILQISILFILFIGSYALYFYSKKIQSIYLKFISLLLFWSWFTLSWVAVIHNIIHIVLFLFFDLISIVNYMNVLSTILIIFIFISLSIDIFKTKK